MMGDRRRASLLSLLRGGRGKEEKGKKEVARGDKEAKEAKTAVAAAIERSVLRNREILGMSN